MDEPVAGSLWRDLAPQALGALVRRYGHFDLAEDAVQEALLAASVQWPQEGVPASPRGWLITVAARRLTDLLRAEEARRRREANVAALVPPEQWASPRADDVPGDTDDTLILLFLCCHRALSPASQIALTLRAVGGLTTAEIARAFLVSEGAMTRRITRAKRAITDSDARFAAPAPEERTRHLPAVRHALYLIFTEGYAATSGPGLLRPDLCAEAIRLTRLLHRLLPADTETAGLLALMLLTDARRPARTAPDGQPVPMAEQDRSRWDAAAIGEGVALITATLQRLHPGPFQLQAAIAAVHDEAAGPEDTDWPQILALYELLREASPNPVVSLNHAVAAAMTHGPRTGLDLIDELAADDRLATGHRFHAVRAQLLEMAGDTAAAHDAYLEAARHTASLPHQRYLHGRAAQIAPHPQPDPGGHAEPALASCDRRWWHSGGPA
jgi:RNA polymerase sigma factor (sigma-70 family)